MELVFYDGLAAYGLKYSRPHIWKLERQGKFPMHVTIGSGRVAWVKTELDEYLAARLAARGKPQTNIAA